MATIGLKANEQKLPDDFDNFSFDDYNFDVVEPKDDRHPVMKVIQPVGRGAKEYITNSSNIEKFVRAALPKGYGQAYDLAKNSKDELKQLYNSAAEEIKPAKETAKKLARKALPHLDGKIPKGLQEKLANFSKEEEQWQARQGDGRDEQLSALLSGIFEQKAKDQVAQRNETNEREKIRQGFETIRHRDQISQLDSIRIAAETQVQYQNKVTFNYQKKQLELNYRLFWAMADLNKEQKRSNAEMLTELKATRINTGLPDYSKQNVKEKFKELTRNKFLDGARENLFGGMQDYLKKFATNIGEQVVGKVRGYSSAIESMGSMMDMTDGMGDMPGVNMRDEAIAALTQFPMDWAAGKASKKANEYLAKNRTLRRGGSRAEYMAATAGDRLKEHLTSRDKQWSLGNGRLGKFAEDKLGGLGLNDKLEGLRSMLASALPSTTGDVKMEVDSINNRHEARPFSRSNSKSLDEVIPGLLARIHREIKILRTGDENTPLVAYDYTKNKFSTESQMASDLRQRIVGGRNEKKDKNGKVINTAHNSADDYANKILGQIDRGGKLTPEQRDKARKMLIEKSVMGESFDISNISSKDQWGGGEDGDAISSAFNRYLRADNGKLRHIDGSYKRQMGLINAQKDFSQSLADPRAHIQQLINAGQLEMLQNLGIVTDKNEFNLKAYAKWMTEENATTPSTTTPPTQQQRQHRRVKRPGTPGAGPMPSRGVLSLGDMTPDPDSSSGVNRHGEEMLNELRSISAALRGQEERQAKPQGTVEKNVQSIVDLLNGINQKYDQIAEANYAVLSEMLQKLSEIAAKEGGMGGSGSGTGGVLSSDGSFEQSYTSLWEHVKDRSSQVWGKTKAHARHAKQYGGKLWNEKYPKAEKKAKEGWEYLAGKANDLRGKMSSYYGDVVVAGEKFPRLRANLLKAGEYRDKATGRIITSLEDISGDVVDASGNVVITMEEFYNSYITGNVNKKVKEAFSSVKSKLEDWKVRLQDYLPGATARLKNKAIGLFEKVRNVLPPYDVYAKNDMSRPLIYATGMRYEMYFSKRTGKPIKHPRFIDGPVIDDQGNIVISEEHIKQGLVDVAGDPVGKGLGRLMSKGMRKATQAWEVMRDAAVGLFGSLQKGLGNVGEHFKNFFAPFADMITNSRKTVTLLEQIHEILDTRLPGKKVKGDMNGDGVRDGSIEDIHSKREKDKVRAEHEADGRGDPAGGGIVGKMMAGLGGLLNKKKKEENDDEDEDEDDGFGLDDAADLAEIYDAANGDGKSGNPKDKKARRKAAKKRLARMKGRGKPGFFRRMGNKLPSMGGVAKWGTFNTDVLKGAGKGAAAAGAAAAGAGAAGLRGTINAATSVGRGLAGDSKLARLARWGMFNTDIVKGIGKGVGLAGKGVMGAAGLGAKLLPRAGLLGAGLVGAHDVYQTLNDDNKTGLQKTKAVAQTAGGVAGGWAGASAGAALGATAGSVVPIVGTAVGGVLGGIIGGAFGYWGGSSLVKKLGGLGTWWNKSKLSSLSKLRLAQYGISAEDKTGMDQVFQLEAILEPQSSVKEDGNFYLNEKEVDFNEIAELFGIQRKADMELFNYWYRRRFVPVYRFWLNEVRKVSKDGKLKNIESIIPGKEKLAIAEKSVGAMGDAFNHMVGWTSTRSKLAYNLDGVRLVLESINAELQKDREADGGKKAEVEARSTVAATSATAVSLAQKALTDAANYEVKDKDGKTVDAANMQLGELTEKIKKGDVTVSVAISVPQNLMHNDKSTLDALTSIRYKAYGLTHMSADKARMLSALEMLLGDHLDKDTDNPKLSLETDRVMKVAGETFGVPNATGEHAVRWKAWFNGRFLPVFLLWAGSIRKKTGKTKLADAHKAFPLEDQAVLARAIIAAQGMNQEGARVSIWQILTNPWSSAYELNSDPDSTAGNMEAIRQLADKVKLGEVSGKVGSTSKQTEAGKADTSGATVGWSNPFKKIASFFHDKSGKGVNATGDKIVAGGKDAKPLSGIGESLRFSGGGSGNYTELPTPSGAGWSENRELLMKAAAMAGVDPRALIATVAVESGFNPNAAPKNPNLPSSAKGLGQHLDSSWLEDLRLHGKKFGIPNGTTQFDARASALMTAARLRTNGETLQKNLGRQVTVTDLYLAHLMGLGGATKFLKAPPDAIAADEAPTTAKQHPEYFYEGGRALTVKDVYAKFAQKLAKRPAEFGVSDTDMKSTTAESSSSTGTTTVPAAQPTGSQPATSTGSAAPTASTAAPAAQPTAKAPSFATTPSAGSPSLNQPIAMDKGKGAVMGTGPKMVAGNGAKYELILQREESEDDGTYGTLRFPDGTVLNTIELPWRNNEARISCIPPGQYECKKRPSQNFGAAYEVQNVPGRSAVLIHAGNSAGSADKGMKADSQGCILLGMDRGRKGNQKVITASKAAMQLFYEKMQDQPFTLIVRNGKNNVAATGDKSVNLDAMRQPTVNATVAPKQEIPPQAATPTASFKPQGPRTTTPGSGVATSTDLPRYNSTSTSLSTTPTSADMQQRDAAVSSVIAPKIDSIANTLLKSFEVQTDGVKVLREILGTLQGSGQPEKAAPQVNAGKAIPQTSTSVPVPQRRSV